MLHYWLYNLNSQQLEMHQALDESEPMSTPLWPTDYAVWLEVPSELDWTNVKINIDDADPENPVYSLVEDLTKTGPAWEKLREQRGPLLTASDWTQLTDSPLAAQDKTDWANYRQYLRDLPQNEETADVEIMDFDTWLAAQ